MVDYHESWPATERASFETVIRAHGGWAAWDRFDRVRFRLRRFRGALVLAKGLGRTFSAPFAVTVEPKARRVAFHYEGHDDLFEDGKVTFGPDHATTSAGPGLFARRMLERWYPPQATYFFGYAWANYFSYPFILPRFELVKSERRPAAWVLDLRFPVGFHTHCEVQRFHFDHDHMLRRHDYRAELAGPWVFGAHETADYTLFAGLQVARTRKVRARVGSVVLPIYGIYGELELAQSSSP